VDIPCGCESRKDIMFTRGGAGITELVIIVGVPVLITLITRKVR
jgi:hypothetical protein